MKWCTVPVDDLLLLFALWTFPLSGGTVMIWNKARPGNTNTIHVVTPSFNTNYRILSECCSFYLTCAIVSRKDGSHRPLLNSGVAFVLTLDCRALKTVFSLSTGWQMEGISRYTLLSKLAMKTTAITTHKHIGVIIILFHPYFRVNKRLQSHTFIQFSILSKQQEVSIYQTYGGTKLCITLTHTPTALKH